LSYEDDWIDKYKKEFKFLENKSDYAVEKEKRELKLLEDNNPSFFSEDVLLPYDIEKRTKFLLF
jgi:hypothetical protein